MKNFITKRYYETLDPQQAEELIRELNKSLPSFFDVVFSNLVEEELNTAFDILEMMMNLAERHNYIVFTFDGEYFLKSLKSEIVFPYNIEIKDVVNYKDCIEREFMMGVFNYMMKELYYTSFFNYDDFIYENEVEMITGSGEPLTEEDEEALNRLDHDNNVLNSLTKVFEHTVEFSDLMIIFDSMNKENQKKYQCIIDILNDIQGVPISLFHAPNDDGEETSFMEAFRIEYDFDNVLTEANIRYIDEHVNNFGLTVPSVSTRMGYELPVLPDFKHYISLIENLYKLIENEFTGNNKQGKQKDES